MPPPPGIQVLLLLEVLLVPAAQLFSLQNCSIHADDPHRVSCDRNKLDRIPSDVPKTVEFLSVRGNSIPSIQGGDFSGLTRLQSLDLSFNYISYIEDRAFSHLSVLTKLSLGENRLAVLTEDTFQGLSNLSVLDLGLNKLQSIPPSVLAPLRRLQELDLSGNRLSSLRDFVFSSPSLRTLDLSRNMFTSFESENLPFPLHVSDLSLNTNPLRRFRLRSDMLPHLQRLEISTLSPEFEWDVPDKAFLKHLKTLDLSYHSIVLHYEQIFHSVGSVESLHLHMINLESMDRGLLNRACGIQSLQKMDLRWNEKLNNLHFESCSQLTELDLSENYLTELSPSALQMLTHLSKLNFKLNFLTRVPLTIRNMTSLRSLSLRSNRIQELTCLDFSNLRLLTELDLGENDLLQLNSCGFRDLQSLKTLNLRGNDILQFDDWFGVTLPGLVNLSASSVDLLQKQDLQNKLNLRNVVLESETGTYVEEETFHGLSNLKHLIYCPILISDVISTHNASRGRSLQQLNLTSLQSLQLFTSPHPCYRLPPHFLKGLDNLKQFSSQSCFISHRSDIFNFTLRLTHLVIRRNVNWDPAPELFQPITALESLDLSENNLTSLDFLLEAKLRRLQRLIFTHNQLSVVDEKVFEELPSLQHLDLSGNPFACNCSNAGFIHWVVFNRQVFVDGAFGYRCASPRSHLGLLLLDFEVRWCWESSGLLCFVCSSTLVLLVLLVSFVHHFFRFHLLYSFYLLRAFLLHRQKQRRGCAQIYDAFVSYSVHDEQWVYRELVPELEQRQGWKLCLHHRDFLPGKAILENITDAIYSSRKTLCVISAPYLHSDWCSREIQMASFRLLDEQKDVLVLLFLEELSSNQLSPFFRMRKLLKRRTYLIWDGGHGDHRGLFWERVRLALQSGDEPPAEGPGTICGPT